MDLTCKDNNNRFSQENYMYLLWIFVKPVQYFTNRQRGKDDWFIFTTISPTAWHFLFHVLTDFASYTYLRIKGNVLKRTSKWLLSSRGKLGHLWKTKGATWYYMEKKFTFFSKKQLEQTDEYVRQEVLEGETTTPKPGHHEHFQRGYS